MQCHKYANDVYNFWINHVVAFSKPDILYTYIQFIIDKKLCKIENITVVYRSKSGSFCLVRKWFLCWLNVTTALTLQRKSGALVVQRDTIISMTSHKLLLSIVTSFSNKSLQKLSYIYTGPICNLRLKMFGNARF